MELTPEELHRLCAAAAVRAGADAATADSLAAATVRTELRGRSAVGASHLTDHLDAVRRGAVDGAADPVTERRGAVVRVDACRGTVQRAADDALPDLLDAVAEHGAGILAVSNSYTCGELGDYTARLADRGYVALAAANAPAAVALGDDGVPVIGTNPVSLAAPAGDRPFLLDQAVSPTALVSVQAMADAGEPLPDGWAVDATGAPTRDATAALAGALLPDGGYRTGNIGLAAEVLAGLAGGTWSLDAPSFTDGSACPSTGMLLIAIDPSALVPGFPERLEVHLSRLERDHGIHVPGRRRSDAGSVTVDDDVVRTLAEE